MSAETDDRVIIIINYRLNIFIAGEPHVELRTHNFELSVEIVGWLEICVSNLSQNLFVVVDHVSPGDFQRGAASATRSSSNSAKQFQTFHHHLRQLYFLVVWVEWGKHADRTFINFFSPTIVTGHSSPAVALVTRYGYPDVAKDADSGLERVVLLGDVLRAADGDDGLGDRHHHHAGHGGRHVSLGSVDTRDDGGQLQSSLARSRELPGVEVGDLPDQLVHVLHVVPVDGDLGPVAVGHHLHAGLQQVGGG